MRHLLRLSSLRNGLPGQCHRLYTESRRLTQLKVGAIVLAPGYEIFDARLKKDLGYGRFPNVLTALEFERILSASGPYSGHVLPALRPAAAEADRLPAVRRFAGVRPRLLLLRLLHVRH